MMIHAIIYNPNQVQADLWPFAMKYAVWLLNRMPKKDSSISPNELFYNSKSDNEELRFKQRLRRIFMEVAMLQ